MRQYKLECLVYAPDDWELPEDFATFLNAITFEKCIIDEAKVTIIKRNKETK